MIHICVPARSDKNLALAYNEAFRQSTAPWVCVKDGDVMFLQPNFIEIMENYVLKYPDTGVFLAYTNRISPLAHEQNYFGEPSSISDVKYWLGIAESQANITSGEISDVRRTDFSGFLMLIKREVWEKYPFEEYKMKGGCIGVDTMWSRRIRAANVPVRRMNRLLVFHSYRIHKEITDKSHLT